MDKQIAKETTKHIAKQVLDGAIIGILIGIGFFAGIGIIVLANTLLGVVGVMLVIAVTTIATGAAFAWFDEYQNRINEKHYTETTKEAQRILQD